MYHRRGPILAVVLLVVGIGLIFSCLRGLASREGMYDQESQSYMVWSQIVGIVAGIAMTGAGVFMIRLFFGI